MTLIIDATVVVALLISDDPDADWAADVHDRHDLAAPHLLPSEVASALRRAVWSDGLSTDLATSAHYDLADLAVELFPYEPFAERVWALRENLTPYDAWYVALAEALDAPLATLDDRLAQAPGPRCRFLTPDT